MPASKGEDSYFAALGRLISAYALAEAAAHVLVRYLSGLEESVARQIFGGMRIVDITKCIKGIMGATQHDSQMISQINECLRQLSSIANGRHRLVHRTTEFVNETFLVDNTLTAKSRQTIERDIFSMADLEAMRADCNTIFDIIFNLVESMPLVELAPWRYTPPLRDQNT